MNYGSRVHSIGLRFLENLFLGMIQIHGIVFKVFQKGLDLQMKIYLRNLNFGLIEKMKKFIDLLKKHMKPKLENL